MIRVGVNGAAGRMGTTVCEAVSTADDMELAARSDPSLGVALADVVEGCDVIVDFTRPDQALDNARICLEADTHVVIGTTGFDVADLSPIAERSNANALFAPNFAIGAVLMMRFAAEASRHMARAEIVELHHDGKLDRPSGTAARTAELMQGEVPISSVRLPGIVANQEVILGDLGQTLTIRHDTINRESFMPGVLLAIRRIGDQRESLVVGLEPLLFD